MNVVMIVVHLVALVPFAVILPETASDSFQKISSPNL